MIGSDFVKRVETRMVRCSECGKKILPGEASLVSMKRGKGTPRFGEAVSAMRGGRKLPGNNGPRMWCDREVQRLDDATKVAGLDWSKHGEPGYKARGFNVTAAQRFRAEKQGGDWFNKEARSNGAMSRFGSKFDSRKAASAAIAKIPFPLAQHIARSFRP